MAIDPVAFKKKLKNIHDLPTLPSVARQIMEVTSSPRTNASDVGRIIEHDQSLTSKVLRLVNSTFYGVSGQVRTVHHAVVMMGFSRIKAVVLATSVFSAVTSERGTDMRPFWMHALGTALGSRAIAPFLSASLEEDDAMVSGLIHDIGKLIFELYLPEEYAKVHEYVKENNCLILEAEYKLLGIDHASVGFWLAEIWDLPKQLCLAIANHHRPMPGGQFFDYSAAIHIGDILARSLGVGNGCDNCIPVLNEDLLNHYGIRPLFWRQALERFVTELEGAGDFFELMSES